MRQEPFRPSHEISYVDVGGGTLVTINEFLSIPNSVLSAEWCQELLMTFPTDGSQSPVGPRRTHTISRGGRRRTGIRSGPCTSRMRHRGPREGGNGRAGVRPSSGFQPMCFLLPSLLKSAPHQIAVSVPGRPSSSILFNSTNVYCIKYLLQRGPCGAAGPRQTGGRGS